MNIGGWTASCGQGEVVSSAIKLPPFHSFNDSGKTALQNVTYVVAGNPLRLDFLHIIASPKRPLALLFRFFFNGDAQVIVTVGESGVRVRELLANNFAACIIRVFSGFGEAPRTHRCLLEHSLHVQICIVHCASGDAVAGLIQRDMASQSGEMNCCCDNKREGSFLRNQPEPRLLTKSSTHTTL